MIILVITDLLYVFLTHYTRLPVITDTRVCYCLAIRLAIPVYA